MSSVTRQVNAMLRSVDDDVDDLTESIALFVHTQYVQTTPVDLGFAAAGWQLTKVGLVWWVTNSVIYIIPLDEGHSGQAPGGMTILVMSALDIFIASL